MSLDGAGLFPGNFASRDVVVVLRSLCASSAQFVQKLYIFWLVKFTRLFQRSAPGAYCGDAEEKALAVFPAPAGATAAAAYAARERSKIQ